MILLAPQYLSQPDRQVTAEAFEDAGIIAEELQTPRRPEDARQKCGVFVGVGVVDYLTQGVTDAMMINAYTQIGAVLLENATPNCM